MSEYENIPADGNQAAEELGAKLKALRESRSLSVGEVAERLKLPARQIEALESGRYEGLPEMVFVRGFLRTYGRFVDIGEQEMADYLERIAPQERVNTAVVRCNKQKGGRFTGLEEKKGVPAWLFGVAAVAAIVGGVYWWQGKSNAEHEKRDAASPAAAIQETAASNLEASNVKVMAMPPVAAASEVPAEQPSAAAADGIAAADELVLNVRYRSVLVVKDKDGRDLINRIVPARSEHRFKGGAPYSVRIGYATGSTAQFGSSEIAVSAHMVDKKTAQFTAGQ
ncbi:MAG: DUF4115 domain-containing protein [Neisseria sp.]|nr:DUF4115 domain-containing protein [Neisseria sp.]